ncbi:uncharacterized protein [Amphiura filiformis]|uniref:uncharacterized protein n=1 Tax=Amphiura filiformis TaxID=82378 RepID=UPI003B20BDD2
MAMYQRQASTHIPYRIAVLFLICFLLPWTNAANTGVDVSSPINPVVDGGILAINCNVQNMQSDYTVHFLRVVGKRNEQITVGDSYMQSSLLHRVFLATRPFSGGTVVYFLTLVGISLEDKGKYICKVTSLIDGSSIELAKDSVNVEVYSLPNRMYPTCQQAPEKSVFTEGERLSLTCNSEKAYPSVHLKWSCSNRDVTILDRNFTNENMVSSELAIHLSRIHNRAVFTCKLSSIGFPDMERSCQIGPLSASSFAKCAETETSGSSPKVGSNDIAVHEAKASISGECNHPCSSENKHTVLYLAAGTMGATILMLTFLTTTVIMCCKFHKITSEITQAHGSVPLVDGNEPMYVSLQRRPESERSSIYSPYMTRPEPDRSSTYSSYMTVEDPSNPGNNVMMPKEVFDEFYRSLSLKKGESRN